MWVSHSVVINMASSLPSFPPFDVDEDQSSIGPRWSTTPATATTAAVNETCYEAARRALNDHFTPRVNTDFETFTFRQSKQLDGESFEMFHTRLQQSAKNCGFTDKDREIKAQLTIGCTSTELRRKILEKPAMTLDAVLNKARAIEAAATQATKMEKESE